jgi:hypothetical protein
MARDLDELEPTEFERLVNDLLLAELGGQGLFVPNATRAGTTDGGYDASFDGPYAGNTRHWTVSAKHVRAKRPLAALRTRVLGDAERHPGRAWLVATNASVGPSDPLRSALREKAPGSEVAGREALEAWLRRYPWVAGRYGLLSIEQRDPFEPADRPRPPVAARRNEDVAEIRRRLDGGVRCLIVVGPAGSGAADVAAALAHDLVHRPSSGQVPIWVRVSEPQHLASLGAVSHELHAVTRPLLLVPPSPVALRAARLLKDGPAGQRLVAFLSPAQAREFPESDREAFELNPLTPEEMRAWVRELRPSSREDFVAAVVSVCGGQPGAAATLLTADAGMPALRDEVAEQLLFDAQTEGAGAQDALIWLLLLLPIVGSGSEERRAVASATALTEAAVERILERALPQVLVRRGDRIDERAQILVAAAVQRHVGEDPAGRFRRGVAALPDTLRQRAARRLAQFTDLDAPLLDVLRPLVEIAATGDFTVAQRALKTAADAAALSRSLAGVALRIAESALDRLGRVDSFADIPTWATRSNLLRQFAFEVGTTLVVVGRWTEHLPAVVDDLVALGTLHATVPLEKLGEDLADPLHPSGTHLRRVAELISGHVESVAGLRLLEGVATKLLADSIHVSASLGRTLHWGRVAWNERNPDVSAMRVAIVDSLLVGTVAAGAEARTHSWRVLQRLWDHGGPVDAAPPPGIRELAERVLNAVPAALARPGDWDTWVEVESAVLHFLRKGLASSERMAGSIATFSTAPDYQAWRWLARPRSLLVDPPNAAAALATGGWSALVPQMAHTNPLQASLARSLAQRVAKHVGTLDDLERLLHRVAATPDATREGWMSVVLLKEWMQLRPELFRPLVLGRDWRRVPARLRAVVLHAAQDLFGEELSARLRGLNVDGARLGAEFDLASLLHNPTGADAADVADLLPSLLLVLPVHNRAAALFGLAAHPDASARACVAAALTDWVQYRTPRPDTRDAVAIVERLEAALEPRSGGKRDPAVSTLVDALDHWSTSEPEPDDPPGARVAVVAAVGWAVLRDVTLGAGWSDVGHPFVEAAAAQDPDRWLSALDSLVAKQRLHDARALLPHSRSLVTRVVRHAITAGQLPSWVAVLDGRLSDASTNLPALASEALHTGFVNECAWMVAEFSDSALDSDEGRAVLEQFLGLATPELASMLVDRLAIGATTGPQAVAPGKPSPELANAWDERATRTPGPLGRLFRRVAERIGGILAHRQDWIATHAE